MDEELEEQDTRKVGTKGIKGVNKKSNSDYEKLYKKYEDEVIKNLHPSYLNSLSPEERAAALKEKTELRILRKTHTPHEIKEIAKSQAPSTINLSRIAATTSFGKSTYDEGVDLAELEEQGERALTDRRGQEQSGILQLANGIAKGGIGFVGSMFDTAGVFYGGIKKVLGSDDSIWDNGPSHISKSMSDWAEEALPNYYTNAEQEDPWYHHILSANFLGDKFAKNTIAFTAGMFFGGSMATNVLGKLASGGGKATRGLLMRMARGANSTEKAAKLNNFARAWNVASQRNNTYGIIKDGIRGLTTDAIMTAGEASVEARETARQAIDQGNEEAKAKYGRQQMQIKMQKDAAEEALMEQLIPLVESGRISPEEAQRILQEKLSVYDQKELEVIDAFKKEKERVAGAAIKAANEDYILNFPILLASNAAVYGKLLLKGNKLFRMNTIKNANDPSLFRRAKDKLALGERWKSTKTALTTGEYGNIGRRISSPIRSLSETPYSTNKNWALTVLKSLGKGVWEGSEELLQKAATEFSIEDYKDYSLENPRAKYAEGYDTLKGYFNKFGEVLQDPKAWEEFFLGFMSVLGIPTFGKSTNRNAFVGKDKWVGLSGGVVGDILENKERIKKENELVEKMNERYAHLKPYYTHLIEQQHYEKEMADAAKGADMKAFKDAEHSAMLSDIALWHKAGRLSDLKEILTKDIKLSEEDYQNLVNSAVQYKNTEEFKNSLAEINKKRASIKNKKEVYEARLKENEAKRNEIDKIKKNGNKVEVEEEDDNGNKVKKKIEYTDQEINDAIKANEKERQEIEDSLKRENFTKLEEDLNKEEDILNNKGNETVGPITDASNNPLSIEDAEKELNERREKLLDLAKTYERQLKGIDRMSGQSLNEEQLAHLTWIATQEKNWQDRAVQMIKDFTDKDGHGLFDSMEKSLQEAEKSIEEELEKENKKENEDKEKISELEKYKKDIEDIKKGINTYSQLDGYNLVQAIALGNDVGTGLLKTLYTFIANGVNSNRYTLSDYQKFIDLVNVSKSAMAFNRILNEYLNNNQKLEEDLERTKEDAVREESNKKLKETTDKIIEEFHKLEPQERTVAKLREIIKKHTTKGIPFEDIIKELENSNEFRFKDILDTIKEIEELKDIFVNKTIELFNNNTELFNNNPNASNIKKVLTKYFEGIVEKINKKNNEKEVKDLFKEELDNIEKNEKNKESSLTYKPKKSVLEATIKEIENIDNTQPFNDPSTPTEYKGTDIQILQAILKDLDNITIKALIEKIENSKLTDKDIFNTIYKALIDKENNKKNNKKKKSKKEELKEEKEFKEEKLKPYVENTIEKLQRDSEAKIVEENDTTNSQEPFEYEGDFKSWFVTEYDLEKFRNKDGRKLEAFTPTNNLLKKAQEFLKSVEAFEFLKGHNNNNKLNKNDEAYLLIPAGDSIDDSIGNNVCIAVEGETIDANNTAIYDNKKLRIVGILRRDKSPSNEDGVKWEEFSEERKKLKKTITIGGKKFYVSKKYKAKVTQVIEGEFVVNTDKKGKHIATNVDEIPGFIGSSNIVSISPDNPDANKLAVGSVYYYIPTVSGKPRPVALRVKAFSQNKGEWNPLDENNKNTKLYKKIRKALENLITAKDAITALEAKTELSKYLVFNNGNILLFNINDKGDILVTLKNEKEKDKSIIIKEFDEKISVEDAIEKLAKANLRLNCMSKETENNVDLLVEAKALTSDVKFFTLYEGSFRVDLVDAKNKNKNKNKKPTKKRTGISNNANKEEHIGTITFKSTSDTPIFEIQVLKDNESKISNKSGVVYNNQSYDESDEADEVETRKKIIKELNPIFASFEEEDYNKLPKQLAVKVNKNKTVYVSLQWSNQSNRRLSVTVKEISGDSFNNNQNDKNKDKKSNQPSTAVAQPIEKGAKRTIKTKKETPALNKNEQTLERKDGDITSTTVEKDGVITTTYTDWRKTKSGKVKPITISRGIVIDISSIVENSEDAQIDEVRLSELREKDGKFAGTVWFKEDIGWVKGDVVFNKDPRTTNTTPVIQSDTTSTQKVTQDETPIKDEIIDTIQKEIVDKLNFKNSKIEGNELIIGGRFSFNLKNLIETFSEKGEFKVDKAYNFIKNYVMLNGSSCLKSIVFNHIFGTPDDIKNDLVIKKAIKDETITGTIEEYLLLKGYENFKSNAGFTKESIYANQSDISLDEYKAMKTTAGKELSNLKC